MKRTFYNIILLSAISFISCGAPTEKEVQEKGPVTKDSTTISETPVAIDESTNEINSKYNYDKDWEIIKKLILDKDFQELAAWARADEFDAEMFIEMAQEEFVQKALKNTNYKDLRVEEMNGEMYLVFNSSISETDEEGNEYGSGLSLYIYQGDPSLMLEYFIAAG